MKDSVAKGRSGRTSALRFITARLNWLGGLLQPNETLLNYPALLRLLALGSCYCRFPPTFQGTLLLLNYIVTELRVDGV